MMVARTIVCALLASGCSAFSLSNPGSVAAPPLAASSNDDDDGENDAIDLPKLIGLLGGSPCDLLRIDSNHGIRGVYAERAVAEGSTLLQIPLSSCLRDDQPPDWLVQESPADESSAVYIQDWVTRLTASLLETQYTSETLGEGLRIWLSLLPSKESLRACLPIHWSEEIVQQINYRPLELAIDSAYFARAVPLGDLLAATPFNTTKGDVEYALDLVQTRSCRISSNGESSMRVLVPVFDMINHSPEHNAEFVRTDNFVVVRALRAIQANEEICINYGGSTVPAWKRLFSYGFCSYRDELAVYEDDVVEVVLDDDGKPARFEVSPTSISEELIRYEAQRTNSEVEFTTEIGLGIVNHLVKAAERSQETSEALRATDADVTPFALLEDLHASHRTTLLACAGGLKDYLQEQQE